MARKSFDKLSRNEQRVVIAKDLILRLDAKKFIAITGTYFRVPLTDKEAADGSIEVRDLLKQKTCRGCQIGGMFLCAVDRHNKLSLDEIEFLNNNDAGMREYLRQFFSDMQLQELEAAFERWDEFKEWDVERAEDRMRSIAQNIIRNKGRFVGGQLLKG